MKILKWLKLRQKRPILSLKEINILPPKEREKYLKDVNKEE